MSDFWIALIAINSIMGLLTQVCALLGFGDLPAHPSLHDKRMKFFAYVAGWVWPLWVYLALRSMYRGVKKAAIDAQISDLLPKIRTKKVELESGQLSIASPTGGELSKVENNK